MWIPIFLGIAVGLSVHASWGVAQCKQKEKEITKSMDTFNKTHSEKFRMLFDLVGTIIKKQPTQQPTRAWHWKHCTIDPDTEFPADFWACEACNGRVYGLDPTASYSYCPHCGIKMDNHGNK